MQPGACLLFNISTCPLIFLLPNLLGKRINYVIAKLNVHIQLSVLHCQSYLLMLKEPVLVLTDLEVKMKRSVYGKLLILEY